MKVKYLENVYKNNTQKKVQNSLQIGLALALAVSLGACAKVIPRFTGADDESTHTTDTDLVFVPGPSSSQNGQNPVDDLDRDSDSDDDHGGNGGNGGGSTATPTPTGTPGATPTPTATPSGGGGTPTPTATPTAAPTANPCAKSHFTTEVGPLYFPREFLSSCQDIKSYYTTSDEKKLNFDYHTVKACHDLDPASKPLKRDVISCDDAGKAPSMIPIRARIECGYCSAPSPATPPPSSAPKTETVVRVDHPLYFTKTSVLKDCADVQAYYPTKDLLRLMSDYHTTQACKKWDAVATPVERTIIHCDDRSVQGSIEFYMDVRCQK